MCNTVSALWRRFDCIWRVSLHPYFHFLQYYCISFCKLMHKPVTVMRRCDTSLIPAGKSSKYFTVNKNRNLEFSGWKMILPASLPSCLSGALLCAMHKAQRDEVSGAVWWRSLRAPGGLPGPDGERDGAQGRLCLQAALRSLPAAVREHDAPYEARLLQCFSSSCEEVFVLLQQLSVTPGVWNVPNYPSTPAVATMIKFYLKPPR